MALKSKYNIFLFEYIWNGSYIYIFTQMLCIYEIIWIVFWTSFIVWELRRYRVVMWSHNKCAQKIKLKKMYICVYILKMKKMQKNICSTKPTLCVNCGNICVNAKIQVDTRCFYSYFFRILMRKSNYNLRENLLIF